MEVFLQNFFLISSWKTPLVLGLLFGVFGVLYSLREKLSFSQRMFLGLLLGVIFGFLMQVCAGFPQGNVDSFKENINLRWLYESYVWFEFFATIFVSFLKLLVVPIVFVGILYVILSLKTDVRFSSMFMRSSFWLLFTTAIACIFAVSLGVYFDLGSGMGMSEGERSIREIKSLNQIFLGLIPSNIIESMGNNRVIGVVIFALVFALSAKSVGEKYPIYQSFVKFIEFLHAVVYKFALGIITFMPYAVVVMMASIFLKFGFNVLKPALLFIALIYVCALCMFIVYLIILALHGLNPWKFCKKAIPALLMAFTSRSSIATLPVTISTLRNKLGVSEASAPFIATLGTSIGANGCAGYFGGLVGVFALHAIGMPVGVIEGIMIVILSVFASIGVAGIPGTATMAASIVLTGLGMGEYFGILAIILGIDPIMDMARTMSNVSGAMIASIATDKEMGSLNIEEYNS
ncbi:dicarboxylate/amino acid:cation symporter [Helicobacter cholecystus]|nr:cation:dicarboxylase symporter family transporter [Helicobacter cholecystus]VEJ24591.1 sodium:dicarboxylate symporter protein [Helicobacter cholecystus]